MGLLVSDSDTNAPNLTLNASQHVVSPAVLLYLIEMRAGAHDTLNPASLAPLVEQLELERPTTVSVAQLTSLVERAAIRTPLRVAIQRLAARGSLLPAGVCGTWEFAPGERAGAYSSGDPLLPVQAVLSAESGRPPGQQPCIALGSALWLHDLADRAPGRPEVAMPERVAVPVALTRLCHVARFSARIAPVRKRGGLLVHSPATILVHMAHRPRDARTPPVFASLICSVASRWPSRTAWRPHLAARCGSAPAVPYVTTTPASMSRTRCCRFRRARSLPGGLPR